MRPDWLPDDVDSAPACVCGHGKYQHLHRKGTGGRRCLYDAVCKRYRPQEQTELGL